jgi:tetratricopeptide (TPR) repeat protein
MSSIDSAQAAFGDLRNLDDDLDRYAVRKQLNVLVVHPEDARLGSVAVRPLTQAEAALMPVRLRSEYGVNRRIAGGVAARARKLAEPYAGDAFAQVALAEAEYDAKNYEAADAAADRALAADPPNVRALIYKGRAQIKLAKAKGNAADWDQVRSWFLKANKLDTENAQPLALFYETFIESGQQPTKNAVGALLYAVALAPQDNSLRLKAVRELVVENRLSEAKSMLAPIAYLPHGSRESREAMIKAMTAIAAGDSKTALSIIDKDRGEEENDS